MLAVDSRSAHKRQTTHCIYSIFQPEQIFAPGVANIAQTENAFCRPKKLLKLSGRFADGVDRSFESKKRRRLSRRRFPNFLTRTA
jgi:hypothetical protein